MKKVLREFNKDSIPYELRNVQAKFDAMASGVISDAVDTTSPEDTGINGYKSKVEGIDNIPLTFDKKSSDVEKVPIYVTIDPATDRIRYKRKGSRPADFWKVEVEVQGVGIDVLTYKKSYGDFDSWIRSYADSVCKSEATSIDVEKPLNYYNVDEKQWSADVPNNSNEELEGRQTQIEYKQVPIEVYYDTKLGTWEVQRYSNVEATDGVAKWTVSCTSDIMQKDVEYDESTGVPFSTFIDNVFGIQRNDTKSSLGLKNIVKCYRNKARQRVISNNMANKDDTRQPINKESASMPYSTPEELQNLYRQLYNDNLNLSRVLSQYNPVYHDSREMAKPLTNESIDNCFQRTSQEQDIVEKFGSCCPNNSYTTEAINDEEVRFYSLSKEEREQMEAFQYTKDTLKIGNKQLNFKRVRMDSDWSTLFGENDDVSDKARNLDKLISFISYSIRKEVGSFDRVKTFYVFDGQLVINDYCYMPNIPVSLAKYLPRDTVDYVLNGHLAHVFDWTQLKKMSNLKIFGIDSVNMFCMDVLDSLGYRGEVGVEKFFKMLKSLDILMVADKTLKRESLQKDSGELKSELSKHRFKIDLLDNYNFKLYNATDGFQRFGWNCLKNYATSRGDKGFFHYACGTMGRVALAGVGSVTNLGAHLIGGIWKTAKSAFSTATSYDVSDDIKDSE